MGCNCRKAKPLTVAQKIELEARRLSFERHGTRSRWDRYLDEARRLVHGEVAFVFAGDDEEAA